MEKRVKGGGKERGREENSNPDLHIRHGQRYLYDGKYILAACRNYAHRGTNPTALDGFLASAARTLGNWGWPARGRRGYVCAWIDSNL